jgi:hypothetical protein
MALHLIDTIKIGWLETFDISVYRATNGRAYSDGFEPYTTEVEVNVDDPQSEYIIGGRVYADWQEVGNLITAMYPSTGRSNHWDRDEHREDLWNEDSFLGKRWHVTCKTHIDSEEFSKVHGFCMAVKVPNTSQGEPGIKYIMQPTNEEYVRMERKDNQHVVAELPSGYVLIGGGARAEPYFEISEGGGTFLTSSKPTDSVSPPGWEATTQVIGTLTMNNITIEVRDDNEHLQEPENQEFGRWSSIFR